MKYKKNLLTNLIILLLIFALGVTQVSCGSESDSNDSENDISVSSKPSDYVPVLSLEQAQTLVDQDRRITEMFVCNSLCTEEMKENAASAVLPDDNEFASFASVEALLYGTYTADSGEIEFFLTYPVESLPAVSNNGGKTVVFCHNGSSYSDFIDSSTISIADTDSQNIKLIKAQTVSGKSVELTAVYSGGFWLLEKGIYHSNPEEIAPLDYTFPLSNLGSLADLNGEILVIELFISDDDSEFSEEAEAEYHKKISSAIDSLAAQAEAFGNEVNITYDQGYFEHENSLENEVIYFDIMIAETGFGTLENFAKQNYDIYEYDNFFFVVCLNKEFDTSFGVYDGTEDTSFYIAERAVVGSGFSEAELSDCVLKLLGNPDFEDGYLKELYKAYFPNALEFSGNSEGAVMSDVTAYACGVISDLAPIYRVFLNE